MGERTITRAVTLLRDGKSAEAERDFLDALALAKRMSARRFLSVGDRDFQILRSRLFDELLHHFFAHVFDIHGLF